MRSEKHLPPLPLLLAICCLGTLHPSSGFPQSVPSYMEALDIPESEKLAFCFSQWTALPDQEQIPSFVMDLCSSIYNRMKVNEENNHEIYKRFLFQFSRTKDPSLKTGESQIATAEYTKRDSSGIVGRPFFLFRPRNGRKVSINEH
uniref:Neuromedin-S n=1 Tax=Bombina orientalis TaxID=8346 RepID=NMS_BOMOR|nr:RecName: Full=Neuromedin-S; Contains: RecName: Full=Neuromedin-S-17; Short=NmS-17; Flags: Precursor [Bombina orientalis]CAJ40976.1 nms-17 protein [Bombina orientalis]